MLSETVNIIKIKLESRKNDIFTAGIIILTAVAGFGLGRLSAIYEQKKPIEIEYPGISQAAAVVDFTDSKARLLNVEKMYVVSKNSDKYHLPWCSGAQRIKEENKIWFASKEDAEKAGYKPSANCKGI